MKPAGTMVQHERYFVFGELWRGLGPQEETDLSRPNGDRKEWLFTGKEFDVDTGLYYFGARYFDPRTAVWQSTDPALASYMGGEPNAGVFMPGNLGLYTYTWNNPIVLRDPDGRNPAAAVAAGGPVLVGAATICAGSSACRQAVAAALGAAMGWVLSKGLDSYTPPPLINLPPADLQTATPPKQADVPVPPTGLTGTPLEGTAAPSLPGKSAEGIDIPSIHYSDFLVGPEGTVVPLNQGQMQGGFDAAGFPSRLTTQTSEPGRIHTIPTPHGSTDVRTMSGSQRHPRRAVTTEAGTNNPVRVTGERFRSNEPRNVRRAESHLTQKP